VDAYRRPGRLELIGGERLAGGEKPGTKHALC